MATQWSETEQKYIDEYRAGNPAPCSSERISTIVTRSLSDLGMLAALRFLSWARENPEGVASLPTGKTPEYFIHWVGVFLSQWKEPEIQKILHAHGLTDKTAPSLRELRFVQIDEFYPIDTKHQNSFYYYVRRFYIDGFGLDEHRAMLINPSEIGLQQGRGLPDIWPDHRVDLSLRERHPRSALEKQQQRVLTAVDQFCQDYEARIRAAGGIGFFLGGIGPDGHIGFNVRGSDHHSTTRLCPTNYETQAAAAVDLGGIEIARTRLVVTIGLSTITYNPQCTAIIIAAGESKAPIVRAAICDEEGIGIPASALRALPRARFYLTEGAAKHLEERNYLRRRVDRQILQRDSARIITELALSRQKRLIDLTTDDFHHNPSARLLAESMGRRAGAVQKAVEELATTYQTHIMEALHLPTNQVFLHTAPHHDDIMLGYIPYLARLIRDPSNTHHFNYLTSGFTSVTNHNLLTHVKLAENLIGHRDLFETLEQSDYFDSENRTYQDADVLAHLDGVAANNDTQATLATARRFLRNLNRLYRARTHEDFATQLRAISNYVHGAYPGMRDKPRIQQLKGMIREWEADLLWGFFGFNSHSVIHSRLGFYKGAIFTEQPQYERDIKPIIATLERVAPTIISVALDPEGSGPDTHYKVLQAISTALHHYQEQSGRDNIEVWGYRNVWYRYQPFEANAFIPVSLMSMAVMQQTFLNSFISQAEASFPSYEFDGPFSGLAQKVQVEQYAQLLALLGREFFYQHTDSRIRSTRGMIFLKKMDLAQFHHYTDSQRKHVT